MSTYLERIFLENIKKNEIKTIIELGSRDLVDANILSKYYNTTVISFECNPDCLRECYKNLNDNIILVEKAVSENNCDIDFYAFDKNKYNNIGASSIYKIDFSNRDINDPDYNRENPQVKITVPGIRMDTYCINNNIKKIDLLCMDLQGYELNALKSFGEYIKNNKYIILECSINSTYINGCNFKDIYNYLSKNNFKYICSDKFGYELPYSNDSFCEFNSLFINDNI